MTPRYRVLLQANTPDTVMSSIWPMEITLVRPGGARESHRLLYGSLRDLGSTAGELRWTSEWVTQMFVAPTAPSGAEVGFRIGEDSLTRGACAFGINALVVIESVTTL